MPRVTAALLAVFGHLGHHLSTTDKRTRSGPKSGADAEKENQNAYTCEQVSSTRGSNGKCRHDHRAGASDERYNAWQEAAMGHSHNRKCYICGYDVADDDSTYCSKHADYSNRPDEIRYRHCTWCGSTLYSSDDGDECSSCLAQADRDAQEMYELDQSYKQMSPQDTPDYQMATCPRCGIYSVHRRLYRNSGGFISFLTGGVVQLGPYETDEYRCKNCGHDHTM